MVRGMHAMAPTKSSANLARKPPVPSSKKAESAADRQVAELQRQIAAASEREAALANLLESSGVDSIAGGAIDWELDACRALLDEEVLRRNFAILTPQFPDRSTPFVQAAELEALERDWQLVTESNAGLKSMVAAQLALAAQLDEMPAC